MADISKITLPDGTSYDIKDATARGTGKVSGVKGNAETSYRTGNVNLTPANIGALPTTTKYAGSSAVGGTANAAAVLEHKTLDATTINNTAGTFAFSGSGEPWAGTDWVGFQVGDNADKFQITVNNGGELHVRQNDSGGTNSANWGDWKKLTPNTWRGIQNNLTSTSTTESLSAAQGKALNDSKVPTTRKVNGHALSADVTVTKSDVGLGNVTNNPQWTLIQETNIAANTDLNTLKTIGNYTCPSDANAKTCTNIPSGLANAFVLKIFNPFASGNYLVQELFIYTNGNRYWRFSRDSGSSWSGWASHLPNTNWTTHLYAGSGTAANAATTNGNTKITVTDNSSVRNSVTIKGTGATTVTSDANGVITVHSTDSNTNNAVTQTNTDGTNANYRVLLSATADDTTRTEGARKDKDLTYNPSTGNLAVTKINGVTVGSSPKFTDNNTTYSAGSNITLSGTTFSLTKANVTGALGYTPPTTNTTYSAMSQTEATTGTATTARSITAKVLHDTIAGSFSRDTGIYKLPDGLVVQWGSLSVPYNSKQTKNFPTAFSTECLTMQATCNQVGFGTNGMISCKAKSKTQYEIYQYNAAGNSMTVEWFAIGH